MEEHEEREPGAERPEVESTGYTGPDRRALVRREADFNIHHLPNLGYIVTAISLAGILVSWGVSWETTQASLKGKVDKSEQQMVDAKQEAEISEVRGMGNMIISKVDSANLRLSQMACDGKPASCR